MATTPPGSPQRAYRANCPNCGAPVEFASSASASAVCGFCRSTLLRDGESLRRIGTSAELFDDHSPLQLGARGTYKSLAFTLVGRLQVGYAGGTWNEWHALFDTGRSGWLSEDNGAYVFAFDAAWPADAPPDAAAATRLIVGRAAQVDGRAWTVASVTRARLIAAQGELPSPPKLDGDFIVIDLRNAQDEVGTLDHSDPKQGHWSSGRPVLLADLQLTGLAEAGSEKSLAGRTLECPGCGASLEIKLATTQTITCSQCNTVTDVSKGIGGDLAHYQQNNSGEGGLEPLIPLGASAKLMLGTGAHDDWQVVGYQERCDLPDPGDDQVFWREYLLYNRMHGFAFLVDSEEDGWSWVRPITGVPMREQGDGVSWRGFRYVKRYTYRARVTWVLGEFYWRVLRDQTATVSDYAGAGTGAAAARRLSLEETDGEAVWSAGQTIEARIVAKAFGMSDAAAEAFKRDPAPLSSSSGSSSSTAVKATRGVVLIILFVLVMIILVTCSSDDCDGVRSSFGENSAEYRQCKSSAGTGSRTSGGSWGGYSGGGGHK